MLSPSGSTRWYGQAKGGCRKVTPLPKVFLAVHSAPGQVSTSLLPVRSQSWMQGQGSLERSTGSLAISCGGPGCQAVCNQRREAGLPAAVGNGREVPSSSVPGTFLGVLGSAFWRIEV